MNESGKALQPNLLQRRDALSDVKRTLLARRLNGFSATEDDAEIPTVTRSGLLLPSLAQERLWFLHQIDSTGSAYNEFAAYRIHGGVDQNLLNRTIKALIQRHEILRTGFAMVAGRLTATLHDAPQFECSVIDLRHLNSGEREHELARLAKLEGRHSFDLSEAPLLHLTLLRLNHHEDAVFLNLHHIICDGWSIGILLREFGSIYSALTAGKAPTLPPLRIQYSDFAHWQRRRIQEPQIEAQLTYWKDKLAGAPPRLILPFDRPRPRQLGTAGRRHEFYVSHTLTSRLRALGRANGATLFMTLLAVFDILLSRYTRQSEIVVGTPTSGRTRPELEPIVGCFLNMLVLRINVSGEMDFLEYLGQVRQVVMEAFVNQDLPFEVLVEHLRPERDLSSMPIFQVMFVLQNFLAATEDPVGLSIRPLPVDTETSKADLSLMIKEMGEGLQGVFEYRTDLFDTETVERAAAQFVRLIEEITNDPGRRISSLPLLSASERDQIITKWNTTDIEWGDARPFPRLFEAQVSRAPNAVAVSVRGDRLTYKQLNQRANELAHRLRQAGVRSDVNVAICLHRSIDLAVALLGVMKAGGSYVPIDPRTPKARIAEIVADANAHLAITTDASVANLGEIGCETWLLDRRISGGITSNPLWPIEPEHLAYVIYTSGSTGQPKGVQIRHAGLSNVLLSVGQMVGDAAQGTMLAVSAISFDISAIELFMPLIHGGAVEIADEASREDGVALAQYLDQYGISLMQATPTTWRMLIASGWRGRPGLEILCGGEILSADLAIALIHRSKRVWNLYGPTETTIWSTFSDAAIGGSDLVPIGRPIANTRAYVLDARLEPAPIGVIGDLYLAGVGIACGYLNRPDLTASHFIPDPFGHDGSRMYLTGDLARYRPDGVLEFHGRSDNQVKIRGFRIEPGEIEAVLREHPAVNDCVVVAEAETERLIAYVVPAAAESAPSGQLRTFVSERLPSYMVPGIIHWMEHLPRTSSGKIDRRALPPVGVGTRNRRDAAAADWVMDLLSTMFANILSIAKVAESDSFFDLGGHSILATQLVTRIQETFGIALPVREIFDAPTIAQLAASVITKLRGRYGMETPSIIVSSASGPYPLSLAQEHLWKLYQANPRSPSQNVARAIRLEGPLDLTALRRSLESVVLRHAILQAKFQVRDGVVEQVIDQSNPVEMAVLDLSEFGDQQRDERATSLVWTFSRLPFDLENGPLLRALILRLGPDLHQLTLASHHIVCDGWSLAILGRDLRVLYDFESDAQAVGSLPMLPVRYFDFACWEHSPDTVRAMNHSLSYWLEKLNGLAATPSLRDITPAGAGHSFRYGSEQFVLDAQLTGNLHQLSGRAGVSLFMSIITALTAVIRQYGGHDDIALATLVANRMYRETQDLIGPFVNTIVFRASVPETISLENLLQRVRATLLEAYAHQELPFELLVEHLRTRSEGAFPLHIMVIYQNIALDEAQPTKLRASDVAIVAPDDSQAEPFTIPSTFDLILQIDTVGQTYRVVAKHALDVLTSEFVRGFLSRFQLALGALLDRPETRISEL